MQIINPFDAGGYTLAEMTQAINILPNFYNRVGRLGLFRKEGITQRTVIIEQANGTLNLLPSLPLGAPATVGNREGRSMRSFSIPHIPHDDVILPQDIQGIRAFGSAEAADPLAEVMNRKLRRMRQKHDQTLEYMEVMALQGITKDGAGTTLYNWHTEFGITKLQVDFLLGTAGTEVAEKCRQILRHLETNLLGETMSGVHVLVGPAFWDKLIKHASVKDAYKYFAAQQNPLREDTRKGFPFNGVVFEEYNATVTLADGSTSARLVPDAGGIAFPLGTSDVFTTYFAPANLIDTVNTIGQPAYARQVARTDGRGIDVFTESNPLPVVKRPALVVEVLTSN